MFKKALRGNFFKFKKRFIHISRTIAEKTDEKCADIEKIRNIGILAHIDAGKTTTTERMLYYSGVIRHMGEVHDGNTVTDFMDQERQRGITICSAAVTFNWKNYRFNLIDTPGHIDFTMGVEQTLGILDGVVIVLDGSAGVEAQTSTVWRQADKYDLPRLVYVNKMDRLDADFGMCLKSLEDRLNAVTFPVHLPYKDKNDLNGIIDVVTLEKVLFDKKCNGTTVIKTQLNENEDADILCKSVEYRRSLIDKLSGLDDDLANIVIEQNSLDKISSQNVVDSLRRMTVSGKGVPVLCGSSYKNIGVQSLMDGVVLYLPTPNSNRNSRLYKCFGNNLSARVFKIIHDKQRGPISFFRVYTGTMAKGQKVYNVQREQAESGGRLYAAYADDYEEIPEISEGNIAALAGLKYAVTGDLLTSSASAVTKAKKYLENKNYSTSERNEKLFSIGTNVPDAVFFCSIEPPSLAFIPALETALQELEREDPSLRVTYDDEMGQIILGGMGELHIDIIKERIRNEYKIDVDLGELQIAYKETIDKHVKDTYTAKHEINQSVHEVTLTMSLIPSYNGKESLLLDRSPENAANVAAILPKHLSAIRKGVASALTSGPKLGCAVVDVGVKLHCFNVKKGTSESIISAAVSQSIKKMMETSGSVLLEPIMNLEIVTLDEASSGIIADLSRKRGEIKSIDIRGKNKVIECLVPLSELLGYSTQLRVISSGNASFSMEFSHYKPMAAVDEREAIRKVTGF